ncbi:hypothetical protein IWQ60_003818 [Tieghemiomyces parasiticus]|uniref:Uncharacterized protein n=1 Tax=Tieghemiomyces parasiticus TaxID=78921 RepID=A0A9W8AC56_9FUNG|nr:hypothetical protein IWQ60_003818 [Tieghemiomyces parasiticus]
MAAEILLLAYFLLQRSEVSRLRFLAMSRSDRCRPALLSPDWSLSLVTDPPLTVTSLPPSPLSPSTAQPSYPSTPASESPPDSVNLPPVSPPIPTYCYLLSISAFDLGSPAVPAFDLGSPTVPTFYFGSPTVPTFYFGSPAVPTFYLGSPTVPTFYFGSPASTTQPPPSLTTSDTPPPKSDTSVAPSPTTVDNTTTAESTRSVSPTPTRTRTAATRSPTITPLTTFDGTSTVLMVIYTSSRSGSTVLNTVYYNPTAVPDFNDVSAAALPGTASLVMLLGLGMATAVAALRI